MTEEIEQRVLLVPRGAGLGKEDKAALKAAGILLVVVKEPKECRLLTSEPWPIDSNALTRVAFDVINGCSDGTKARAYNSLMKAILSEAP